MHEMYAVTLFRGKFEGEILFVGASCTTGPSGFRNAVKPQTWELCLPPGVLQRFLQPSAYFSKPKSLSSDPAQSLYLFGVSLPTLILFACIVSTCVLQIFHTSPTCTSSSNTPFSALLIPTSLWVSVIVFLWAFDQSQFTSTLPSQLF